MTEPASTAASSSENSSQPLEIVIGIDIGTSPCHVSVWNGSAVAIWKNEILEMMKRFCEASEDHDFSIGAGSSTAVSLENLDTIIDMKQFFNIIFGESAKFPFLMHTVDIKGRPFVDAFMKKLWKTTISVELLGKFLIELTSMIETEMNGRIRNVVFTVPVSFSLLQLNQIHRACEMAGLKVIITPQPTAVALWYVFNKLYAYDSSDEDNMDNEIKKIALIFNMDAGYCDVSVIEAEKGKFRIKAMAGSTIGGEDLLRNMMCHLLPDSEKIFKRNVHWNSDITSMASLRSKIQGVIIKLSSETSAEVDLESVLGLKIQRVVTRMEFEDVNKDVFDKCENLITDCLKDAKIEAENINDVIIVGGCCNIPRVENLVTKKCNGNEIYKGMNNCLNAVLCGAVVAGAIVDEASDNADLFTSQVTLHDIGILADGKNFEPVIPKNTSVPTGWNIGLSTVDDNQTTASIVIYEGVEEGQMADENNVLGNLEITEIPEAPKGVPKITVSMTIDHRNRLTVTTSIEMPTSDQQSVITQYDDQFLIRTKFDDTIDLVNLFDVEQ